MPAGSIHFSSRAPIGYVVISSEPVSTNQGFKSIVPAHGVFNEYVYYFLKSAKSLAENRASGTTFRELSGSAFSRLPFPLAPTTEQHRIVAKIEELFSELDNGVENLKIARDQLQVYRQAVLKHAFEGNLTAAWREDRVSGDELNWSNVVLGDLLNLVTSGSRGWAKYYSSKGDVFIRAKNLKYDRLDLDDVAFVQIPEKSEGTRTRAQVGDILITITGANVTKTAFIKADIGTAYVSQHVALARPTEALLSEFLHWFLVSEATGRKQLNASAYGAGKPGLNLDNIRSVLIPLPTKLEQMEIINRLNSILSVVQNCKAGIDVELKRKKAEDTKSGAGQYFTPRALIRVMVECVQPEPGKTIADPACGTGGFFLACYDFISNARNYELDKKQKEFLKL
jgi:type I restriction enzyme, S subunit